MSDDRRRSNTTTKPRKRRQPLLFSISFASSLASATAAGTRAAETSQHEHRRLHTQRTLSAWRHLQTTGGSVRPLDLRIDENDPTKVYQVGAGGFLEPYDFVNYQEGFGVAFNFNAKEGEEKKGSGEGKVASQEGPALSSSSSSLSSGGGNAEGIVHFQSERMGVTNFDLNRWTALQGYSDVERRMEQDAVEAGGIRGSSEALPADRSTRKLQSSRASFFKYTPENDPYELDEDSSSSRHLQGAADEFVAMSSNRDTEAPVVRQTFPPAKTKIGPNQSFGALVSDNGTGVKSVCLQFKDHTSSRSDCFELVMVGQDIWELTFDGFNAYEGETWAYRVRGKDGAKNRVNTEWADFIINISGKGETETQDGGSSGGGYKGEVGSGTLLTTEVSDDSWPYGGVIQQSTGRILFFFDGNAYVCTGTVLDDQVQDRTVILTAGHCAYQYSPSGGRFADYALYIPDQDSTTGTKSDEICGNDPYGCWIPAFAVVDVRWTQQGFPDSVPYDYAFYVIPNDVSAHQKGYLYDQYPNLSELLPDLTEPIPVDWNYDHRAADFTTGLGYSFDKDPDFRYCSGSLSTKYGIQTYENLWIDVCEMTGGSSGGPWMVGTDSDGRGTVVSVNSWGYTSSSGMAGPKLSTGGAECLYEKARTLSLSQYGGYVVSDCQY